MTVLLGADVLMKSIEIIFHTNHRHLISLKPMLSVEEEQQLWRKRFN